MNRREWLRSGTQWLGLHMLAGCAFQGDAPVAARAGLDSAAFDALRRFAHLEFGEVAYVSHGEGPAALFLHGFPLNGFQWRGAMSLLAPYRRCLAPDLLGMGRSRAASGLDVGPEAQADMLVALLDHLGIPHVDLVANDSGGVVAQLLVLRHHARVRTLLLTNCDTERQSPPAAMLPVIQLAKEGRFVDEWLMPWLRDPTLARSAHGIGGLCYADSRHPTDEALRQYFGALAGDVERRDALHRHAMALERNALAGSGAALKQCRVPTRIAWGMADGIFEPENADFLDAAFGHSLGVRRLAGAKLFWPEERPDIVAAQARILWETARAA
jgi:haloalkane dehalogenase